MFWDQRAGLLEPGASFNDDEGSPERMVAVISDTNNQIFSPSKRRNYPGLWRDGAGYGDIRVLKQE